jgi:hypothetical protein
MKVVMIAGMFGLAAVGAGCNTHMTGTAPAKEGYIYAVGARNSRPTVWLCPSAPGKGECQAVAVEEIER